jgi:2-deoxy-D-gluconate 3-dehydrogenase
MSFDLAGRTALVTGASRGIGRAIALAFASAGADVALLARDEAALSDVAAEVDAAGRRSLVLPCDVLDPDALSASVGRGITELGGLDVLVNNAGGNSFSVPFTDMRYEGWDKTLRLNLDSTVHACRAVGGHMIERGSGCIINMASVAGLTAVPTMAHYGAAKAAVISLTRTLAVEWASAGVRVNALVPGWIETDLTEFARRSDGVADALLAGVPMRRWGTVGEVAEPALFLASSASAFMTGQVLVVDGGLTAT